MSRPHISLIIPSALRTIPGTDTLWLTRAIQSTLAQTLPPQEILVGLDPGVHLPGSVMALSTPACPIRQANGDMPGHQAACNAAVKRAGSPLLAFLEDDDFWTANHLELLVQVMDRTGAQFVSTSQEEVNPDGSSRGTIFDYPTASGWLLTRLTWMTHLKGFDVRFRVHHDNDAIGRLNRLGIPRTHIIEGTADLPNRPQLQLIARHARVLRNEALQLPTVKRTIHEQSVMGELERNEEKVKRTLMEVHCLEILYGMANTW